MVKLKLEKGKENPSPEQLFLSFRHALFNLDCYLHWFVPGSHTPVSGVTATWVLFGAAKQKKKEIDKTKPQSLSACSLGTG